MFKLLIAENNDLYRSILKNILIRIPDIKIVGTASDGKEALEKTNEFKPDLVTLNIDLPVINGITVLRHLKKSYPGIRAIMVCTNRKPDARTAMEALSQGALETVVISDTVNIKQNLDYLQNNLTRIIRGFTNIKQQKSARTEADSNLYSLPQPVSDPLPESGIRLFSGQKIIFKAPVRIVVIGISTGGPPALNRVIPFIPKTINVPVVIVQHMPKMFTALLAETLNSKSPLDVVEAKTGDIPAPGTVYIAPGEKQLKMMKERNSDRIVMVVTDDPPENFCKPAADYLFRSAAEIYGASALGVIMTGMGRDGVEGLKRMKEKGSIVIAQDRETSTIFGMPYEAIKAGAADIVLPLDRIAPEITRLVNLSGRS